MLTLAYLLAISPPTVCQPLSVERPWVSFAAATPLPIRLETKIPAQVALVDGPEGHRAVSVTVPDMNRDERACSFYLPLPPLVGRFNGVRMWVRGSRTTTRLEIVFEGETGNFGADLSVETEWREVTLGPTNTRPYFSTTTGRLDVTKVSQIRFCFWPRPGEPDGPRTVGIGPVMAVESSAFVGPSPVETVAKPSAPLPLQPFTVDLLDLKRGEWEFTDALGQHLALDGPVAGYAFTGAPPDGPRVAYLCCDPEFPDDLAHAVLKVMGPSEGSGRPTWFRIEEPFFSASVEVSPVAAGVLGCRLRNTSLGPATTGDRYVAGLYVLVGGKACPVWLAPDDAAGELHPRLLTDRVGHVFSEDEPVKVTLAAWWHGGQPERGFALEAKDYASGEIVWRGSVRLARSDAGPATQAFRVPLSRFGVFEVSAASPGLPLAELRVCRVPRPRRIDPDKSGIGINLFQQQIWWYGYQTPLMAKAGVHWIRPWLAWENTWAVQEPEQGKWDTRALDAALRRMDQYGQRYQIILFNAPSRATGASGWSVPPVDKMGLWSDYIDRLVRQYRGRIRYYEVWNEPDLMWPEETRHSGEHYVAMLKATWEAAKRADPRCVILGLSHAGYEEWLERVGRLGAKDYLDAVTIHSYAAPHDFVPQVERRRAILERHGMGGKPLWINELGSTAYDFNPAYSAKMGCSERQQAGRVVALYAQALSFDPQMKAFWFCTYDPRDAAHESQWTYDAGIGVLYLGFLPKLSYATLAGVARELDGRKCLGREDITRNLHQISFEGPVAVVWHDSPTAGIETPATELGCLPDEQVTVRDMFANALVARRAGEVKLSLAQGPFYVEGSRELAGIAQAEQAVEVRQTEMSVEPGRPAVVPIVAPAEARVTAEVQPGVPVAAAVSGAGADGARTLTVTVAAAVRRTSGLVRLRARFEPPSFGVRRPREVVRAVSVTVGEPNLIRDGAFFLGNVLEWAPERTSPYAWDGAVGHDAAGSLRLDGPFDRRLVHWDIAPKPGQPMHLRGWVRAQGVTDCRATLNIALFGPDKWLTTWCLATSGLPGEIEGGWRTVDRLGRMPTGTADWALVEAMVAPEQIPPEATKGAFFIDVKGGQGTLWIDDLDLWQTSGQS